MDASRRRFFKFVAAAPAAAAVGVSLPSPPRTVRRGMPPPRVRPLPKVAWRKLPPGVSREEYIGRAHNEILDDIPWVEMGE